MARTKQTARKGDYRGAQRRPASSAVAKAAVAKRTPTYQLDLKAPGPHLGMIFNRMKDRKLDGRYVMDGPNVSLKGIHDMVNKLDGLKTLLNRAYAKEKWKGTFNGHVIRSIDMSDETLTLVQDKPDEYDPDAEPVFTVYNADHTYEKACTTTTNEHGTKVDMGDFGWYHLDGATGSRETSWTFHAGEDCPDKDAIRFHRSEE